MKSFSYILAALLAGGATVSLTGCIDTAEPSGITDLRGAKALLLKAKAAWVDAKAQREAVCIEQDKVTLESQKLDLQLKQMNVELQKLAAKLKQDSLNAEIEYQIAELQKKRDKVALEAEKEWYDLKQKIAASEKAYKEAIMDLQLAILNYKDEKISEKIKGYTEQLYGKNLSAGKEEHDPNVLTGGLFGLLQTANNELLDAQREKVIFTSQSKNYLDILTMNKVEQMKVLEIQNKLLADLKALAEKFDGDNLQAVQTRLNEVEAEINKLDQKKKDLYAEIQNLKNSGLAGLSQKLAEFDELLDKDTSFVMPVVDAKLQADLYAALANNQQVGNEVIKAFKEVNGKQVMVAPLQLNFESLRKMAENSNDNKLAVLKDKIQEKYQALYLEAFKQFMGLGKGENISLFEDNEKDIKPVYAAQLKNEMERIALDEAVIRKEYKAASDAWIASYEKLDKAIKAYEAYKVKGERYKAAVELIEAYKKEAEKWNLTGTVTDTDLKKYVAEATKLRDNLVKDYFNYRAPLDSAGTNFKNFKKNYIDLKGETAATKVDPMKNMNKQQLQAFNGQFNNVANLLGEENFKNYSYNATADGFLPEFLKASQKLFGNITNITLAKSVQPELVNGKYQAPADLNIETFLVEYSSNKYSGYIATDSKFMEAAKTYSHPAIFSTLGEWVKLYESAELAYDQIQARVESLINTKKELVKANKDAFKEIWQKEIECYLVDGNLQVDKNEIFSKDNPYYQYYIQKAEEEEKDADELLALVKPQATDYDALVAEKELLNGWKEDNKFHFVKYEEQNGVYKYTATEGNLDELIASQEKVVKEAQEKADNIQKRIDLLNEIGYVDNSVLNDENNKGDGQLNITTGKDDKYLEQLDYNITLAQSKVDILKAQIDRVQDNIQKLVAAAEDGNFGVPGDTYPGFDVDVPQVDEPQPEKPQENPEQPEQPQGDQPAE